MLLPPPAGIPKNLVLSTGSQNKLKLVFDVPDPNAASYYEYSVRDASSLVRGGLPQQCWMEWEIVQLELSGQC